MVADSPLAPSRGRGRPSKAKAPPARETLLAAALERFARDGFEKMSLRKLAAEVGISDALLNHHFGSKEALWSEAVELAAQDMTRQLTAVLDRQTDLDDPLERVIRSVAVTLRLIADKPDTLRLGFREESSGGYRAASLRERFLEPYLTHVDGVLRDAQAQGRLGKIDFNALHAMIIGAARVLIMPGLLGARTRGLGDNAGIRDAYIDGVVALLRYGLAGPR